MWRFIAAVLALLFGLATYGMYINPVPQTNFMLVSALLTVVLGGTALLDKS